MTILRRLSLSYLAILGLLGCNLVIYFYGYLQRKAAFEELRQAIAQQILINSIQQKLKDYQKLVALTSEIAVPDGAGANSPEDIVQFDSSLDGTAKLVEQAMS